MNNQLLDVIRTAKEKDGKMMKGTKGIQALKDLGLAEDYQADENAADGYKYQLTEMGNMVETNKREYEFIQHKLQLLMNLAHCVTNHIEWLDGDKSVTINNLNINVDEVLTLLRKWIEVEDKNKYMVTLGRAGIAEVGSITLDMYKGLATKDAYKVRDKAPKQFLHRVHVNRPFQSDDGYVYVMLDYNWYHKTHVYKRLATALDIIHSCDEQDWIDEAIMYVILNYIRMHCFMYGVNVLESPLTKADLEIFLGRLLGVDVGEYICHFIMGLIDNGILRALGTSFTYNLHEFNARMEKCCDKLFPKFSNNLNQVMYPDDLFVFLPSSSVGAMPKINLDMTWVPLIRDVTTATVVNDVTDGGIEQVDIERATALLKMFGEWVEVFIFANPSNHHSAKISFDMDHLDVLESFDSSDKDFHVRYEVYNICDIDANEFSILQDAMDAYPLTMTTLVDALILPGYEKVITEAVPGQSRTIFEIGPITIEI